ASAKGGGEGKGAEGGRPGKGSAPTVGDAPGGDAAPAEGGGGEGKKPTRVEATLLMPEPPAGLSKAAEQRGAGVQHGMGGVASAHAALPPADAHVADARAAVTQPPEEANAKAEADLVAALGAQPAPSPELVQLCERIRAVIRAKRPTDRDKLVEAE